MTAKQGLRFCKAAAAPISNSDLDRMRALPLFAVLTAGEYDALLRDAAVENVPGKMLLLREGRRAKSLFVLLDGLVKLTVVHSGIDATILMHKSPSCFDIAAILRDDALLTSTQTVLDSRLIVIGAGFVRRLFADNAEFARAVAYEVSVNYRDAMRELNSMRTRTSFQRLIAWILAMQRDTRSPSEIELPFDKGVLAARLGMKAETLSRSLSRLAEFGVTVSQRKLRIANSAELRRYAKKNRLCENVLLP